MYSRLAMVCAATLLVFSTSTAPASIQITNNNSGYDVVFKYRPKGSAGSVAVAGSFNNWSKDANPLKDDDKDGVFEARVHIAKKGHITYKFVVDGNQWLQDKENPKAEADGHGGFNSVIDFGQAKAAPKSGGKSVFGSTVERKNESCFTGEVFFLNPNTKRLPNFSKMKNKGKIFAPEINIAPQSFAKGFPGLTDRFEWFGIRYRGKFKAEKSGVYQFRVHSDDGARLYINGKLAIDNDGLHGPRSRTKRVRLKAGEHKIVLDYMQGPALEVALQLFVIKPRSTREELVKPCSTAKDNGTHSR